MQFKRGQLSYFVTVADEGQITSAAVKLHIAQPALSQAIAQLERDLGFKLLDRHPRGVTLTRSGEEFLPKARVALAANTEAVLAGKLLARATKGAIEVGFIGPPPILNAPELFAAVSDVHPEADVSFRDLPFPCGATATWLGEADVAFCHAPAVEPGVAVETVRLEPRAVVVHESHPLAGRSELAVADVLDETFVSYHPDVQPEWAGFHSLDDHRGGPPRAVTVDCAITSLQMLAAMTTRGAVTTVPHCDAKLALQVLPEVVAIPLHDAHPAALSLVWRTESYNPLVPALVALARSLDEPSANGRAPGGD